MSHANRMPSDLQQAVLVAAAVIGPADAKQIQDHLYRTTGSRVVLSSVYKALHWLIDQGWVGLISEQRTRHGRQLRPYGRAFKVTPRGRRELRVAYKRLEKLWNGWRPDAA